MLSLKRPLFDALRSASNDADTLAADVWSVTAMLDRSQSYLVSLINAVLNSAKIESAISRSFSKTFRCTTCSTVRATSCVRSFASAARRFTTNVCEPSLRVHADREKVQQILLNLPSDALQFTPSAYGSPCAAPSARTACP